MGPPPAASSVCRGWARQQIGGGSTSSSVQSTAEDVRRANVKDVVLVRDRCAETVNDRKAKAFGQRFDREVESAREPEQRESSNGTRSSPNLHRCRTGRGDSLLGGRPVASTRARHAAPRSSRAPGVSPVVRRGLPSLRSATRGTTARAARRPRLMGTGLPGWTLGATLSGLTRKSRPGPRDLA